VATQRTADIAKMAAMSALPTKRLEIMVARKDCGVTSNGSGGDTSTTEPRDNDEYTYMYCQY